MPVTQKLKELGNYKDTIRRRDEQLFIPNCLDTILDNIFSIFEKEKILSFIADERHYNIFKQAAFASKSKYFAQPPKTLPKNIGAVILAQSSQSIKLLESYLEQEVKVFIIGKPLIEAKNIYRLPSFSKGQENDIVINLKRLPDTINSVRNIYHEQIRVDEIELNNLVTRLNVATMNANRAIEIAFHELAETKKYFNQLNKGDE